ncbi:hypothetical protein FRC10_004281 [Ceratobasidium sp. 414]|nr:hypothetical protein FRC10_004281 [Ceratobasidium sp. 414]
MDPALVDAHFEHVPDRPGVVTNTELCNLRLGIISQLNVLCCLVCKPLVLLSFPTVAKHVHTHISEPRKYTTTVIQDTCARYGVYQGLLDALPKPVHPVEPFEALPVRDGYVCLACKDDNIHQILFSNSSRRAHFSTHHRDLVKDRKFLERPAKVQMFCSRYRNNTLCFEVFPELVDWGDSDPDDPRGLEEMITRNAQAHDLVRALAKSYRPIQHPVTATGDGHSLKDSHPMLFWTSWAAHMADRDLEMLVKLAKSPKPGDPLHRIVAAAKKMFNADQATLNDVAEPIHLALKDDGSGKTTLPFKALEQDARAEYSATLAHWCVFVLRLYQMHIRGDERYKVTFTKKQLVSQSCLVSRPRSPRLTCPCDAQKANFSSRTVVLNLAHQFWGPSSLGDFQHLAEDRMDDPTARFACLINLHADGSFAQPHNIAHNVVQLKYLVRATLLKYARDHQDQSFQDPVARVLNQIAPYVSKCFVTPFANIASVIATASKYAATSSHAPNVLWSDVETLSVEGFRIRFKEFKRAMRKLVLDAKAHILDKVFQGLAPESVGFDVTETTHLYNNFVRMDMGYSIFTDSRNSISKLALKLAAAFFANRPGYLARGVHTDEQGKTQVTWDDANVAEWLDHYDEAVRRLGLLTHLLGGQPARAVETCLAKLLNTTYHVRNWYVLRLGVIVAVLFYGKGSGNTRYDRAIAHALPWWVGCLFLVLNSLARPLTGMLVKRTKGAASCRVQEISAYPVSSRELKASELSTSIHRLFQTKFSANIGVRSLRHFMIATQKKFMPEASSLLNKVLSVLDTQARHTSKTATEHYAIDASERHLLADDMVLKYVLCSMRWAVLLILDLVCDWEKTLCATMGRTIFLDWGAASAPSAPLLDSATLGKALVDAMAQLQEPLAESIA